MLIRVGIDTFLSSSTFWGVLFSQTAALEICKNNKKYVFMHILATIYFREFLFLAKIAIMIIICHWVNHVACIPSYTFQIVANTVVK